MSGFFNSFYYGKAGKADYTVENLPTNRRALFLEMLRIRLTGIIGMNLLYVLFCLPALIWTAINYAMINQAFVGEIDMLSWQSVLSTYLLGMIPCLVISSAAAPGLMYVLRNWARDQHSFVMSDFKDAVKSNWKQALLVGLIDGLSLEIVYVAYLFYGQMASDNWFFVVPQTLVIMVALVWWMMNMVIFTMMVTYKLKFTQLLRNSAIVIMARLPWAALVFIGSLLPLIMFLTTNGIVMLVGILFYLLIGFGLTGFGYASFANACFDRLINPRIEGAPMNMGLRTELDEEDDDEPNPDNA